MEDLISTSEEVKDQQTATRYQSIKIRISTSSLARRCLNKTSQQLPKALCLVKNKHRPNRDKKQLSTSSTSVRAILCLIPILQRIMSQRTKTISSPILSLLPLRLRELQSKETKGSTTSTLMTIMGTNSNPHKTCQTSKIRETSSSTTHK